MQLWPANEKAFAASLVAAASRSASASTMTGVALPSSRLTRLRGARSASFQPTAPEPVNVIARTRSSSTSTSPSSEAGPTSTFSQPGGSPASVSSSASRSAESGVCEAGFRTTAQPAASAGASLCATRLSGKLNGRIAPTTPIGSRSVKRACRRPPARRPSAPSRRRASGPGRRSSCTSTWRATPRPARPSAACRPPAEIVCATSSCRRPR